MKRFTDRRRYKTFAAVSVAALMAFSSLASVAAAMTVPAEEKAAESAVSVERGMIAPALKLIVLDVDGKSRNLLFSKGTVADVLDTANIKLDENHMVFPSLDTEITGNMLIKVCSAKPVELTADGKTKTVVLAYGNVVESLKLAGVKLGKDDILSVDRDAKVEDIDELTIQRVAYKQVSEKVEIDFEKLTETSNEVEPGETVIGTEGKKGEKIVVKKVKYIDGKAVDETVISEKVTKQPVNEVTLVGVSGGATGNAAGTFTDYNGMTVAYKEVYTGSGTAYTAPAGSGTATGVLAHHGGVAIDPSVIPYGSKLYVEAVDGSIVYGYCTAIDTGGFADDGSGIVDVFYDTYDECVTWGRRDVNVYVIE